MLWKIHVIVLLLLKSWARGDPVTCPAGQSVADWTYGSYGDMMFVPYSDPKIFTLRCPSGMNIRHMIFNSAQGVLYGVFMYCDTPQRLNAWSNMQSYIATGDPGDAWGVQISSDLGWYELGDASGVLYLNGASYGVYFNQGFLVDSAHREWNAPWWGTANWPQSNRYRGIICPSNTLIAGLWGFVTIDGIWADTDLYPGTGIRTGVPNSPRISYLFPICMSSNFCSVCSKGKYSTGNTSACVDADVGYFVNTTGASTQFPCSAGTYQTLTGQSACLACSAGQFFVQSAGGCVGCNSGLYYSQDAGACVSCSTQPGVYAGYYVSGCGGAASGSVLQCTNVV